MSNNNDKDRMDQDNQDDQHKPTQQEDNHSDPNGVGEQSELPESTEQAEKNEQIEPAERTKRVKKTERTERARRRSRKSREQILEEDDSEEEESSFSGLKIVIITVLTIFIVGALAVGISGYYIYANLQPVDAESEEIVEIEVPMGSSATKIASILKENDLIRNEDLFYYYVRFKGHTGFQAGTYYFTKSLAPEEMIELLKEGRVHLETERFTIAEGLTIDQIALHLEKEGLASSERFKELVNQPELFEQEFPFLSNLPQDRTELKYVLEGFLFPETYEIYKGADEEQIIRVMLTQFGKEFNKITQTLSAEDPEWEQKLEERDLTIFDMIVLSSIIEREAVLNEERRAISGIFHNRIDDDWLLQSCATVQFVLGKQRDRILFEDLEVEHPYNTYINAGLPPGPIANPGRESILAAFNPENHDYYFFVTKKDGSGAHHFSRTYEEHLSNDAQSRGNF